MKKTLLILFALLLVASYADARGIVTCAGGGVGASAPACDTVVTADSHTAGTATTYALGHATRRRIASRFVASENYCICAVSFFIAKNGSPSGTLSVKVYDMSSNLPNSELAASSTTLSAASITGTITEYKFALSSCANLSNGTSYFVSLETDTLNDSSNYFQVQQDAGTAGGYLSGYTSSWASLDFGMRLNHRNYK